MCGRQAEKDKKSLAVARKNELQLILFLLQYSTDRSSRSSKVDDFYLIWKRVCDFLAVRINSNLVLSLTVSEIRPFIAWNSPLKIAAKPLQMETWLLLTAYRKLPAP